MMQSIRLQNYKAFLDSGEFNFKKLNILVGPNSSGKSSFIKSLLTLKNTLQQDEATVLGLSKQLGNYNSVIFNHEKSSRIGFEIQFNSESDHINSGMLDPVLFSIAQEMVRKLNEKSTPLTEIVEHLTLKGTNFIVNKIEFYVKQNKSNLIYVDEFNIYFGNENLIKIYKDRNSYSVEYNGNKLAEADLVISKHFYFKLNIDKLSKLDYEDLKKINLLNTALQQIEKELLNFSSRVRHFHPLRNEFERTEYITNLEQKTLIGEKGENTLQKWLTIENSSIKDEINDWLNRFDLGSEMIVETVGQDDYYSLKIKNKYTNIWNNILDMGVGTTQLLPIIIESILPNSKDLLIIEEPETHVHPKAQSKLTELFVECIEKKQKQFIIETHSIFLISKLQVLIAKGELKLDDIGIYYFTQTEKGTVIKEMLLNEKGQFKENWPSGFFDMQYLLGSELFSVM